MLPRSAESIQHTLADWLVVVEESPGPETPPILGCGALVPLTDTLAEVRSLAVHESQQGKGLGGHIVLELLQLARARGFPQVCALTLREQFFLRLLPGDQAVAGAFNDKIEFAWNSEVAELHGADKLEGITLRDTATGDLRKIDATGLFIAIGHDPRSELLKGQVELDDEGYVLVQPGTTETNVRGVFAAGDLVDHTYRQAVTAAGTGCAASLDAERYLADIEHGITVSA